MEPITDDIAYLGSHEPAETLVTRGIAAGVQLVTPRLGRPVEPAHVEHVDAWWRGLGRSHERVLAEARANAVPFPRPSTGGD